MTQTNLNILPLHEHFIKHVFRKKKKSRICLVRVLTEWYRYGSWWPRSWTHLQKALKLVTATCKGVLRLVKHRTCLVRSSWSDSFPIYEINKRYGPLVSIYAKSQRTLYIWRLIIHHKAKSMDQHNTWTLAVQNPNSVPDIYFFSLEHIGDCASLY